MEKEVKKKMICSHCGKDADRVCSNCWRCKDCKLDCPTHMARTINGHVAKVS
jgi:ribosomal protein L37AE/L43A